MSCLDCGALRNTVLGENGAKETKGFGRNWCLFHFFCNLDNLFAVTRRLIWAMYDETVIKCSSQLETVKQIHLTNREYLSATEG